MSVICPHCGKSFTIPRNGRPRTEVDVLEVLDSLRHTGNISHTAEQLKISRQSIYRALKPKKPLEAVKSK